jgi:hypothetical protein
MSAPAGGVGEWRRVVGSARGERGRGDEAGRDGPVVVLGKVEVVVVELRVRQWRSLGVGRPGGLPGVAQNVELGRMVRVTGESSP